MENQKMMCDNDDCCHDEMCPDCHSAYGIACHSVCDKIQLDIELVKRNEL